MEPEWLSYQEVGDRLGVTPEAARSRAKRLGWRRQLDNHGRAVVLVALAPRPPGDRPETARASPGRKPADDSLIKALEAHVQTLKEQLAAAEARAGAAEARNERQTADFAADKAALTGDLTTERARSEKQAAESAAREAALAGDLAAERARTDKAIEAFAALAERLDALAAARSRPWWRRFVG